MDEHQLAYTIINGVKQMENRDPRKMKDPFIQEERQTLLAKDRPISISFLDEKKIFDNEHKEGPFFAILHMLAMMILDLSAATMKLRDALAITKSPEFSDFVLFL